ncbi:MAG: nucleotidyl transferase AbiEii/AbiGii toxin family protein [Candidatus Nitrosotenuis sp.]
MDEKTLRRLAGKQQIPLGTLEKDYALTSLLSVVSRFPRLNSLIFKGGTAIKKIYFEEFRFSEDLDFTCLQDVSDEFMRFIAKEMKSLDVQFTQITDVEKTEKSFKFKAKYLQSNGIPASIRMDLSLRSDVLMTPITKPILHFYDYFTNKFEVPAMHLEEIMVEKIRGIVYTRHPRHLHDVWYLDRKGVKLNPDMVRAKMKSAYNADFELVKFLDRVAEKEKDWKTDLQPLLPYDPPSFSTVSKKVMGLVSTVMK